MSPIHIRRAYEPPEPDDGFRVLVDRLWPRGMARERLKCDLWLKEIAPSPELRRWFDHEPRRFAEFRRRYVAELDGKSEILAALRARAASGSLTLVYAARDPRCNHAAVLKEYLEGQPNPDKMDPAGPMD